MSARGVPARRRMRPRLAVRAASSDSQREVLRASSPTDLLGVVPYLLGFHPQESLVLVAIRRREVKLTARIDLPDLQSFDPADLRNDRCLQCFDAGLRQLRGAAGDSDPDAVVLVGYSRTEGRAEAGLDYAQQMLLDLPVTQLLHADGQRWWSRSCDDECCPVQGTPYDVSCSRTAAAAVAAGMSALPDRAAVAELVTGPAAAEHARLNLACEDLAEQLAGCSLSERRIDLVERLEEATLTRLKEAALTRLEEATALRLAVLCSDVMVRDVAWALIGPTSARHYRALWQAVVDATPPDWAPAPLCLLAVAAWVGGNGALMGCCFERALQIDPGYSMAQLLADMNTAAIPPTLWPEMQSELRQELGLGPM